MRILNKLKKSLLGMVGFAALALSSTQLLAKETVTYFHNDISGSPMLATDASGSVVWKENYRPYGDKLNNQPASANNKIGFAGKPFDGAVGLSYMGGRYYDPVIGRFAGLDPAPVVPDDVHSFNRYAYAANNPYRYIDPDGNTVIDGVFLAYDVGKLALAIWSGNAVAIGEATVDVGLSTLGVLSPVPGTGEVLKGLRVAEKGVEAARAIEKASEVSKTLRETEKVAKEVTISKGRFPEAARHIEDAQKAGKPSTLTIDRAAADANRRESLRGTKRVKGKDRDEYPPAMTKEGGSGASVRPIGQGDNRGAGACFSAQCRGLPDGSKIRVRVVD